MGDHLGASGGHLGSGIIWDHLASSGIIWEDSGKGSGKSLKGLWRELWDVSWKRASEALAPPSFPGAPEEALGGLCKVPGKTLGVLWEVSTLGFPPWSK